MAERLDFESLVSSYYEPLFQFAFSLTREEADACDLVQQTFLIWAAKGYQLRDTSKVKTWLFTTLHREFLKNHRRNVRFPHLDIEGITEDLPVVSPTNTEKMDARIALKALAQIDEVFQAPVALFYLQDYSYLEIAEILEVPMGTVKSRLSRGIGLLYKIMTQDGKGGSPTEVNL
jgi:RNA polymerase sigma-70 factor (ECF subfamily)